MDPLEEWLRTSLNEMIEYFKYDRGTQNIYPGDRVGLTISNNLSDTELECGPTKWKNINTFYLNPIVMGGTTIFITDFHHSLRSELRSYTWSQL